MQVEILFLAPLVLLMSGCAVSEALNKNLPSDTTDRIHLFTHNDDRASNLIEKALSTCFEETEAALAICARRALAASGIGAGALAALIPGCRPGSVCTYDYTTRRRVGFFANYATVIVKDWRVSFDLRAPAATAALVPVAVRDRNAFVVPAAAPAKPARAAVPAR